MRILPLLLSQRVQLVLHSLSPLFRLFLLRARRAYQDNGPILVTSYDRRRVYPVRQLDRWEGTRSSMGTRGDTQAVRAQGLERDETNSTRATATGVV